MPLDPETTDQQRALLATHRRTLAHLLRQAAIFGLFTPPHIAHGIEEARAAIAQLKVDLHTVGVSVDDAPGDLPGTTPIERRARRLRLLSAFVIVVVLAVVVLGASGGVAGIRAQLDAWGVMPAIQPEQPGETLLVIAPFYYTEGNRNTEAHREIARAIQAAAQEAGLKNLRVELAAAPLRSDDRAGAEQMGTRYNASLVIWGDDTGVRVTVNFLNRRGTPQIKARDVAISETERTQIADPPAYNRFITDDLPRQLSFLALFAVGQSFSIKQDYDAAIRVIARAVGAVTPGASVEGLADAYFRLGWLYQEPKHDAAQASVMYDQAIALDSKYTIAYINRGHTRSDQGNHEGAIADYAQAIALDPKNAVAYYNRGIARKSLGDFTGAIADYAQAIALDPTFAPTYNNRGVARESLRDHKGAIEDFNQAIALDPKYATAYYNRGIAHYDQSDFMGAIADYDQAIALDPKNAAVYTNRGNARYGKGDLTEALADYDQAIALNPRDAAAYINRGNIRYKLDDLTGAFADYDQAIALDPKNASAYVNRGAVRYSHGDLTEALADFNQAIALGTKNASAYYIRGLIYQQHGDRARAIADYDQAIALNPKLADAYYSRGRVYQQLNDRTHAIADFEQVLRLTDDVKMRREAEDGLRELGK